MRSLRFGLTTATIAGALIAPLVHAGEDNGYAFKAKNESGVARTISVGPFPVIAPDNPFFQDLGVNGRRCVTCHQPSENMSVSAAGVADRFEASDGKDPIFRLVDGANSP